MKTIISNPRIVLAAGVLFSSLFCVLGLAADAPASSTFTEAQFDRGEALYQQRCSLCHGTELDSAAAPELVGATFRKSWSRLGASVNELFNLILTSMPPSQPGSLTDAEGLDVLAFILGSNNVLQGSEELKDDYDY